MKREVLPGITTIPSDDWRAKIKEAKKLGLKEIALFLTCLEEKERQDCYRKLLEIKGLKILLVHARTDMPPEELQFLVEKFQTKFFNLHPNYSHNHIQSYGRLKNQILIENLYDLPEADVKKYGGICLDLAHLENVRLLHGKYQEICRVLDKYPICANHISGIAEKQETAFDGETGYDIHTLVDVSQLNYLKKMPRRYFATIIAIELTNSLTEQIRIKNYLQSIIVDS